MEGVVPEAVVEAAKRTSTNIEDFKTHFLPFLSLCDADVLSQMDPLQRAKSLLLLAKATTTLFTLRLRCTGVNPDDHPVKSELERVNLYQDKLERFQALSKEPLRPSATLNYQAATRFIEHSLPDLTPDQKQSMREISKGEAVMKVVETNVHKKRKCHSKMSVQTAAQQFLEKATRELLGGNSSGFKGPLNPQDINDNELPID